MFNKIKKFFKTIFLLILLIFIGFMCYRYQELKKNGELNKIFASNKQDIVYTNSTDPYKSNKNLENNSNDNNKNDSNNENKYTLEKKNYDGYYNEFNFDNVLLMYEGNQNSQTTEEALERLINNVDSSLYTKPTIVLKNFNGLNNVEVSAQNLSEYKNILIQAKKSLKNEMYNFSFEYNNLKTMINKIIITKK